MIPDLDLSRSLYLESLRLQAVVLRRRHRGIRQRARRTRWGVWR